MGAALYGGAVWLSPWLAPSASLLAQTGSLALLCVAGALVYFVLAFATGGADAGMVRRNVRRGSAAPAGTEE
jgi:putative peptidoglycan lipid II flippase